MTVRAADTPVPGRWLAATVLMLATAMQAGDATIVNVALIPLEKDLGGGVALGAWIMTTYLCATAVTAPLSGWLRRRYGLRLLFIAAVITFVAASLACAVSPNAGAVLAFRILQGAAGGIIHPMAQAMLLDLYPKEQHGRMLGLWGAAAMLGPIVGPLLGGIITDVASWRWAFAINLPIGIFVLAGIWRALPRSERTESLPIDSLGLILLITAIAALQLTLERSVGRGWLENPETLLEAAVALLATAWMALHLHSRSTSILRLDVLRDLNFAASGFYNFLISALLFTTLVFIPTLTEGPLGHTATVAGATIVPRAVLMMLVVAWVGRAINNVNCRLLLSVGWILTAAGLLILANTHPPGELSWIIGGSVIQALGAGMLFTPLTTLAYSTLPVEHRTDAAGLYSLLRQLGCASGVALMTALLRARVDAETVRSGIAGAAALTSSQAGAAGLSAYKYCFAVMGVVALAVTPGVFVFRGEGLRRPITGEDLAE